MSIFNKISILLLGCICLSWSPVLIIGDSNVGCIKSTAGAGACMDFGKYKVGATSESFLSVLKTAKRDDSVKIVILAIGTNDAYLEEKSRASELRDLICEKYPNCVPYVLWGTYGWGSTRRKNIDHQTKYYKTYTDIGFGEIVPRERYFSNDVSAHKPNQTYHKSAILEICKLANWSK